MKKYKIIMAFLLCLWGISIPSFATTPTIDEIIHELPKDWGECDLTDACLANGLIGESEMYVNLTSDLDSRGVNHLTFQLYHSGIPVEDGMFKIHSKNGSLMALSGSIIGDLTLNSDSCLSYGDIENKALNHWSQYDSRGDLKKQVSSKQIILPLYENGDKAYAKTLEFKIYLPQFLLHESIFIDISTGNILEVRNHIRAGDEPCSGITRFNGTQDFSCYNENGIYTLESEEVAKVSTRMYNNSWISPLNDIAFGIPVVNTSQDWNSFNNEVSVHWAATVWYQFFKEQLNEPWLGVDGDDGELKSIVYTNQNLNGAYWDGYMAHFGDGEGGNTNWVSLDMVSHEFTHGLINATANLIYSGESGALNESFADIFAMAIEAHIEGSPDWIIGEDITLDGSGIRSMSNPTINHYTLYDSTTDIHTNGGIQNYWFYLLSNEIGIEAATNVCFQSLRYYLTPYSDFMDARNSSIQAAGDLFGENSPEVLAVCNAWVAVGVGEDCNILESIEVLAPNGGETWVNGNVENITWNSTGEIQNVAISISADNGNSFEVISDSTPNDGSYSWQVNATVSSNCIFRINDAGNNSILDNSDVVFEIIDCVVQPLFSSVTNTCAGTSTYFENQSTSANSFEWFIDGVSVSEDFNLAYNFNTPGWHQVTLKASNDLCSNSFQSEIYVAGYAGFSNFTYVVDSNKVSFYPETPNPFAAYSWDFGNGIQGSSITPIINYPIDSLYEVCLTIDNDCSEETICQDLVISTIGPGPDLCVDVLDEFTDRGGVLSLKSIGDILWVGTTGGLFQYNKITQEKIRFSSDSSLLPSDYITALEEDSQGNLWIATANGLAMYDGSDFTPFRPDNTNLEDGYLRDMKIDLNGDIWVATDTSGIAKFDGSNFLHINPNTEPSFLGSEVRAITIAPNGDLWCSVWDAGLAKYDGQIWDYVVPGDGAGMEEEDIEDLIFDNQGRLWVTSYEGAYLLDGIWAPVEEDPAGFPSSTVYKVEIVDNQVWFGTGEGIAKYSGSYPTDNFLEDHHITAIHQESNGDVWVGTDLFLLKINSSYDDYTEIIETKNSGLLSNFIRSIHFSSSKDLWISDGDGLLKFEGDTLWKRIAEESSVLNEIIDDISEDQEGNIYVTTGYRVVKIVEDTINQTWNSTDFGGAAVMVDFDQQNRMWVGTTSGGVSLFDGNTWQPFNMNNSDLPSNYVSEFELKGQDTIYFGTTEGLVMYTDDGGMQAISSTIGVIARSVKIDSSGYLWMGFNGGLVQFDENNDIVEVYAAANGNTPMPQGVLVVSLDVDEYNILWVGTNDGSVYKRHPSGKWEIYSDVTGAGNISFNFTTSIEFDDEGVFWGGTSSGLLKLQALPEAFFEPANFYCTYDSIIIENCSWHATDFQWQINGVTVSTSTNLDYSFDESGIYTVSLISGTNNCTDIYSIDILVLDSSEDLDLPEYTTICNDTQTVLKSNIIAANYFWFDSDDVVIGNTDSLIVDVTGKFKLVTIDFCGGVAIDSTQIIFDNDCVWPGETNKDKIVNHHDVLSLGLAYGQEGEIRLGAYPDWVGQGCQEWNQHLENGTNLKHVDANGDGVIGDSDILPIELNYGNTLDGYSYYPKNYIDGVLNLKADLVNVDPQTRAFEIGFTLENVLGGDVIFYGFATTLLYETLADLDTTFVGVNYNQEILGTEMISFQKQFSTRTDFALVGKNQQNHIIQTGSGGSPSILARTSNVTEDEMPGGDTLLHIQVVPANILVIDNAGDTIPTRGVESNFYLNQNFSFNIQVEHPNCFQQGAMEVQVLDASDAYSYTWSSEDGTIIGTEPIINNLEPGLYSLTVEDDSGLELVVDSILMNSSPQLTLEIQRVDDVLNSVVNGGSGNYTYLWNSGANTSSIGMTGDTLYSLIVIDENGCHATAFFNAVPTNNLNPELSLETNLSVSPNPFRDVVRIEWDAISQDEFTVELLDLSGRIIKVREGVAVFEKNQLSLTSDGLVSGTYFIKMKTKDNIQTQKIIFIQ